ncbi:MAG: hypothetical protein KDB54_09320 [Solirubrobacterales bacterium]|nr:hypothetical protein [Solirubrobacterales bacterium]MCB0860837.1 hypothetical protein [Solirubrobacterales bacterium]HRV60132.1 hypothetical protein [Solirubrobacterales bacterium]
MDEEINYRSAIKDFLGRPIPPEGELRIWLDDDPVDREAPEGWIHVRSVREACFALLTGRVVELSLDNDLDNPEGSETTFGTGYQVIDFLEEQEGVAGNPLWPRDGIVLHTANANGRERMALSFEPLKRNPELTVREDKTPGGKPRFSVGRKTD